MLVIVSPPGSGSLSRAFPPTSSERPKTVTECPRAAATQAASSPATPAPTTTIRRGSGAGCGQKSVSSGFPTRGLFTQTIGWWNEMIVPQHVLHERQ